MTREEAIQWLTNEKWKNANNKYKKEWNEAFGLAIEALSVAELKPKFESADAVQGEWKHTITGQPYCSNCEYVFGEDEEFSPFWKYCPMCGARMKGGDE